MYQSTELWLKVWLTMYSYTAECGLLFKSPHNTTARSPLPSCEKKTITKSALWDKKHLYNAFSLAKRWNNIVTYMYWLWRRKWLGPWLKADMKWLPMSFYFVLQWGSMLLHYVLFITLSSYWTFHKPFLEN